MATLTTLHCPNCGAPVEANDRSCAYCGSLLLVSQPAEIALPAVAQAQRMAGEMRERIAINPYDGNAYYQLGLALFTLTRYDDAENAFDMAERYLPGSAEAHYFKALSMLLAQQDDILTVADFRLHGIEQELEAAQRLNPNLTATDAYLALLRGLHLRNAANYRAAIPPLKQAADALPDLAVVHKVLAGCYFQTKDLPNAIRSAEHALELTPADMDLAWLLGVANARLDKPDEMTRYAQQVARLRGEPEDWQKVEREFNGEF